MEYPRIAERTRRIRSQRRAHRVKTDQVQANDEHPSQSTLYSQSHEDIAKGRQMNTEESRQNRYVIDTATHQSGESHELEGGEPAGKTEGEEQGSMQRTSASKHARKRTSAQNTQRRPKYQARQRRGRNGRELEPETGEWRGITSPQVFLAMGTCACHLGASRCFPFPFASSWIHITNKHREYIPQSCTLRQAQRFLMRNAQYSIDLTLAFHVVCDSILFT